MKTTRRHRTARKLVLPLIAIAMMTTMFFMESYERRAHDTSIQTPRQNAAALRAP